jgi:hypothetical protein
MRRRLQVILVLAALASILGLSSSSDGANTAPGKQAPANTTLPTISGTAVQGATVTSSPGSWSGNGLSFAYQWFRCDSTGAACSPISGETGSTHPATGSDVGKTLRVAVVATNHSGSAMATSLPTAVVAAASTPPPTGTTTTTTTTTTTPTTTTTTTVTTGSSPPPAGGYFSLQPVSASLPSGDTCAGLVHRSTWEPRPDNYKRNHIMPDPNAVHAAFAARPLAVDNNYDSRWDTWLLQRVDGQFTGTTDEIFQWAACKWGLSDNMLRAIAVRESTWFQYLTYPSGRPVSNWGSGDYFPAATADSTVYCNGISRYGYDYQQDYGAGLCPKTFSIAGVMSWEAPSWGVMPDNQNGTFPFNRNSTAFALDYIGGHLRGCYEGWIHWLANTGTRTYTAGDIWGCVGSWYSGDWHSAAADGYISRVQGELANFTWLKSDWPGQKPPCDPVYGCPGPDGL